MFSYLCPQKVWDHQLAIKTAKILYSEFHQLDSGSQIQYKFPKPLQSTTHNSDENILSDTINFHNIASVFSHADNIVAIVYFHWAPWSLHPARFLGKLKWWWVKKLTSSISFSCWLLIMAENQDTYKRSTKSISYWMQHEKKEKKRSVESDTVNITTVQRRDDSL